MILKTIGYDEINTNHLQANDQGGYTTQESRYSTNAEVLRCTTEELIIFTKYLPRRLPSQTMGQMGSLHKAHHHHRMRKDQCS